jgi:hypothetical protein
MLAAAVAMVVSYSELILTAPGAAGRRTLALPVAEPAQGTVTLIQAGTVTQAQAARQPRPPSQTRVTRAIAPRSSCHGAKL